MDRCSLLRGDADGRLLGGGEGTLALNGLGLALIRVAEAINGLVEVLTVNNISEPLVEQGVVAGDGEKPIILTAAVRIAGCDVRAIVFRRFQALWGGWAAQQVLRAHDLPDVCGVFVDVLDLGAHDLRPVLQLTT